ncbi:AhpC/TSA family protein [Litorivivens sp.]|uniref:AhpC/TSA family protein n=1 Tax=Litorivivens sp. TaxID=2020868 RepID=UPI003569794B
MNINNINVFRGEATTRLGNLLSSGLTLLVLLRHSGCPVCREHLVFTEGILGDIRAAGCEVVGVCQNDGRDALLMEQELDLHFPVYGEPSLNLYRLLEMPRGNWWQVTLGPILRQPVRALQRMRDVRKPGKDVRQLGGVVLLSSAGEVLFRYSQRDSGDLPGDDEVLAAIAQHASAE